MTDKYDLKAIIGDDADVATVEKEKLKFPSRYNVIMHNDETTPMAFVTAVLIRVFKHSIDEAQKLMYQIHNDGSSVVGNYSKEIAEAKIEETIEISVQEGFIEFKLTLEEE